MAMDRERFQELCSVYVLGALEGEELREFEHALAEADTELKKTYVELRQVALHLPLSVDAVEPSPTVKERILRAVRPSFVRKEESLFAKLFSRIGFDKPQIGFAISFALLMIVAGLGYYSVLLKQAIVQRDRQITAMQHDLSLQHQQFVTLQDELTRKKELLDILQSPKIDVVIMNGQEVNPAGFGKIIWDPDKKKAILQISNLPAVPQGKDYQLWVIKNKKPISAGVFTLNDPVNESLFKIEQLVETDKKVINAFAVTLEPKGGVPQPTGKMYLLGAPSL